MQGAPHTSTSLSVPSSTLTRFNEKSGVSMLSSIAKLARWPCPGLPRYHQRSPGNCSFSRTAETCYCTHTALRSSTKQSGKKGHVCSVVLLSRAFPLLCFLAAWRAASAACFARAVSEESPTG